MAKLLVVICLAMLALGRSEATTGQSKSIIVGVLTTSEYESLYELTKLILKYNVNLPGRYVIKPVEVKVDGKNLLTKDVATNLSTAVCLFDLYTGNKDAYFLAEILGVPLIKIDRLLDDPPNKYVLSIRPHYHLISRALFDIAMYFKFRDVAIIYDVRMVRQATDFYSLARSQDRFQVFLMPGLDLSGDITGPLKTLRYSYVKSVFIICDQKDLAYIMDTALVVGFHAKDYKWITSDIEVAGKNKTYESILGMVGLSLHLVDFKASNDSRKRAFARRPNAGKILSPVAYSALQDSIQVVVSAIKSLISASWWPKIYPKTSDPDSCPLQNSPGNLGPTLLDAIKGRSERGMTGPISFNNKGQRRAKDGFDVLNIVEDKVKWVGSWKPPKAASKSISMSDYKPIKWVGDFAEKVKCHKPNVPGASDDRPRKVLTLTAVIEPPFVEWRNGSVETRPVSNTSLQGFLMDIINEISAEAGFDYVVSLRRDTNYATTKDGVVTGMVGELIDKKVDMALAPITITAQREGWIDFSKPFMDFSQSLIMQEMKEEELSLFAFVQPFDGTVWTLIVIVVFLITIMMFVVDLWSPFGNKAEARETGEGAGDEFNLFNSLWFATASVLQQGPDNTPKSPSGRILGAAFWFFILIIISTYTANLAAFFTKKTTKNFIENLEDLTKQSKISYGVMEGGSMETFLKQSQDKLYRKMYFQMSGAKSMVSGTKAGIKKVRKGGYAYLTEQPYLDYYNQQEPCNTVLINGLLTKKSYGFGMQRNSPYSNEISVAILKLRESGFIEKARAKWWDDRSECPAKDAQPTTTQSLGIKNMAGVFIVLIGGVVMSFLLIIIEIKCKRLVDMLTQNQRGKERQKSRSKLNVNRSQESLNVNVNRDQNNIPVRVVLSQGHKELKPGTKPDPKSPVTSPRGEGEEESWWKSWFGKWI